MHDICFYVKIIINLCTGNMAKAHRDRGLCAAIGNSREQRRRNGAAVRPAGNSWRETWGHTLHSQCPRAAASIPECVCPVPLDLCKQGTATAALPTNLPGTAGQHVQILQNAAWSLWLNMCGTVQASRNTVELQTKWKVSYDIRNFMPNAITFNVGTTMAAVLVPVWTTPLCSLMVWRAIQLEQGMLGLLWDGEAAEHQKTLRRSRSPLRKRGLQKHRRRFSHLWRIGATLCHPALVTF